MKSWYYFLFHTLFLKGSSKIKSKVILIKYSRPIGMFPATQFWVATPGLRTTDLGDRLNYFSFECRLFYGLGSISWIWNELCVLNFVPLPFVYLLKLLDHCRPIYNIQNIAYRFLSWLPLYLLVIILYDLVSIFCTKVRTAAWMY
jgi:hypothetical protein